MTRRAFASPACLPRMQDMLRSRTEPPRAGMYAPRPLTARWMHFLAQTSATKAGAFVIGTFQVSVHKSLQEQDSRRRCFLSIRERNPTGCAPSTSLARAGPDPWLHLTSLKTMNVMQTMNASLSQSALCFSCPIHTFLEGLECPLAARITPSQKRQEE